MLGPRVLVVSNMYPGPKDPTNGIFVKRISDQMAANGFRLSFSVKPAGGSKLFGYLRFFADAFSKSLFGRWDAIYVHFASHSFVGIALPLLFRRLPLVAHVHGGDIFPDTNSSVRRKILRGLSAACLSRADLVIAPSERFANSVRSEFPRVSNIVVSPSGGVDTEKFLFASQPPMDKLRILFLGRLIRGKGAHILIEAIARLSDRAVTQPVELTVAGSGPELERLRSQAQQLACDVNFAGRIDPEHVSGVIASNHLMVFPSSRPGESLGLVALEAMAVGRPVVVPEESAIGDVIKQYGGGFVFRAGDPSDLAKVLSQVSSLSRSKLGEISIQAREAAEMYSGQRVALQHASQLKKHFGWVF